MKRLTSPKIWFATLNLAFHLFLNIVRKFFFWHGWEDQAERMFETFKKDGLYPLQPEDRLRELHFSRCIGCQLCGTIHPLLPVMATTFVRSLDRAPLLKPMICSLSPQDCREGEKVCPMRVPLVTMREVLARMIKKSTSLPLPGDAQRSQSDLGMTAAKSSPGRAATVGDLPIMIE